MQTEFYTIMYVFIDSELMELVGKAFKESLTIQQQQVIMTVAMHCNYTTIGLKSQD